MERILFSIDCTTCRARLAVRSESAIGAILECPKCGSFVEVVPPSGWSPPRISEPSRTGQPGPATLQRAGEEQGGASAPVPGSAPAETAPDSRPNAAARDVRSAAGPTRGTRAGDSLPATTETTQASGATAITPSRGTIEVGSPRRARPTVAGLETTIDLVEPPPGPPPLPAAGGATPPPLPGTLDPELPSVVAVSAVEQMWRRRLAWIAVVAGAAVVLAAAWSMWAARGRGGRDGSPASGAPRTPQVADGAAADPAALPPTPGAPSDPPGTSGGASPPTPRRSSEEPPDAAPENPASQPPSSPAAPGSNGAGETAASQPGTAGDTQPSEPRGVPEDPAAMPPEAPPSAVPAAMPELPPLPDEPSGEATPPAADGPPDAPAVPETVISTADEWAARLARRTPAIEFDQTPWVEAISLLAALGSVPVTIDADVLAPLEVDLHEPVALRLESPTLLEAFDRVAAEVKLRAKIVEGQVLITAPDAFHNELQPVRYSVADLAADSAALAELASWIERLVAPPQWRRAGGGGSITIADGALEIVQTPAVHYEVLVFCEKLRLARGRPLRSRLDPGRFALETRAARLAAALGQNVTANFQAGAPLAEILGYLGGAAEVDMLVDRIGLSAAGTTDGKVVVLSVDREPLRGALEQLLGPLGLAWRAVDGDVLQITSRARVETRLELEFHPVGPRRPGEPPPETLIEQLKSRLPAARWAEGDGPGGRIVFDAPSRCLLVLQSQPVQAAIERLLSQPAQGASGGSAADFSP